MNLRVVRFKITKETYECLVTNLTRDEFDLNELKKMYHMRWNIETAFKMLKYIIGMMSFHSKNVISYNRKSMQQFYYIV
ncbi:MAG: transposase [Holdemanella porci]|uniref:transposase n=1 Tax=Holdemanella porci TaxID=2652276 RepID=UPI003994641A